MATYNVAGATQYGDVSPRTALYAQTKFLERALPFLCLEKFGQGRPIPNNKSKVTKFRRYEALDFTPRTLSEGVTPTSMKLVATDVQATLVQYGTVLETTDVIVDTHEDNVLNEMVAVAGEQAAQMIETIRYQVLLGGTNVQYANGSSRSAVNTPFTLAAQRRVTRALKRQNARPITSVVKSTVNYETAAVAASFIGLVHPDLELDIRSVNATTAGAFVPTERYGTMTPYENELGKIEDVRYLTSTIFTPFTGASNVGGAVGSMIPNDADGTKAMVYPIIYLGQNAFGIVPLKGLTAITPSIVTAKPTDSDPLAQRSKVGWKSMQTAVILNDFFMCRLEVAATA